MNVPDAQHSSSTHATERPCIDVVAAVIRDAGGRILITQRPRGGHLELLWEFPGGKPHPGEDFPGALRRELREELGIAIEVGDLMLRTEHSYPERTVRLDFYACRHVGGEPRALDVEQFLWIDPGDLARYEFPEADRALIRKLRGVEGE